MPGKGWQWGEGAVNFKDDDDDEDSTPTGFFPRASRTGRIIKNDSDERLETGQWHTVNDPLSYPYTECPNLIGGLAPMKENSFELKFMKRIF